MVLFDLLSALATLSLYRWTTKLPLFRTTRHSKIRKGRGCNAPVKRWLESLTTLDYTLESRTGSAKGKVEFLSRL